MMMRALIQATRNPDLGLLLIRSMIGIVGIFHGSQKLFGLFGGHGIDGFAGYLASLGVPAPVPSAWLAGLAEFGGGLLVALGIAPRVAALPFLFAMLVAFFAAHGGKFEMQQGGGEYALTLAVVLAGLVFTGPGRFTVPALFGASGAMGRSQGASA